MPLDFTRAGSLNRRSYLKAVGAGTLATLAFSGRSAAASVEDEYRTVIDVAEEGAATDGSESITPLLEDLRQDHTLYKFPEGRYYMDEQFRFTGFENVGFVGDDATLVPADYAHYDGPRYRMFRLGTVSHPGTRTLFSDFNVDQSAPGAGIRVIDAVAEEELTVRDVWVEGQHDSGLWGPARFSITDPDGKGVVERFKAPYGAVPMDQTANAEGNAYGFGVTGIYANTDQGELVLRDCELGAFPQTGLYAAGADGRIRVEGGRYANSGVAQIRLGGTNSYVRGASVVVNQSHPGDVSQRGIRIEDGRNLRVLESEVVVTAPEPNNHAITVHDAVESAWIEGLFIDVFGDEPDSAVVVSGGAGETVICETDIDMSLPSGYGIWLQEADDAPRFNCQEVNISGDVGDDGARSAILNERDNAEFRLVTVNQTGAPYRNALANWADDVLVYGCGLTSSNYAIKDYGRNLWVEETHADATRGVEAVLLGPGSEDALIKASTLPGGIEQRGATGSRSWDNDY